jgi:hypothetical protein
MIHKTKLWSLAAAGLFALPTATGGSQPAPAAYDPPPATRDDRLSEEEIEWVRRRPSSQESEIPPSLFRDLGSDGRVEAYVQPEPPSPADFDDGELTGEDESALPVVTHEQRAEGDDRDG